MLIEMIEKTYPHVEIAKVEGDKGMLSFFGMVSAEKRRRRDRKMPSLFSTLDLDPNREFPKHHVLYRGERFVLLQPKKRTKKSKRTEPTLSVQALLNLYLWVRDPDVQAQVAEERRKLDEAVMLDVCPID
jgi:hypothetical protein